MVRVSRETTLLKSKVVSDSHDEHQKKELSQAYVLSNVETGELDELKNKSINGLKG